MKLKAPFFCAAIFLLAACGRNAATDPLSYLEGKWVGEIIVENGLKGTTLSKNESLHDKVINMTRLLN